MTNKLFRYNTATGRLEEQGRVKFKNETTGSYMEYQSTLTSYAVSNPKEWEEGRDYTEGEFETVLRQTHEGHSNGVDYHAVDQFEKFAHLLPKKEAHPVVEGEKEQAITIQLPIYWAKQIEDTLRMVSNVLESGKMETCVDRNVIQSWDVIKAYINNEPDKITRYGSKPSQIPAPFPESDAAEFNTWKWDNGYRQGERDGFYHTNGTYIPWHQKTIYTTLELYTLFQQQKNK